jgi:hypothetical protein
MKILLDNRVCLSYIEGMKTSALDRRAAIAIMNGRLCYLEPVSDYSYSLDDRGGFGTYRIKKHIFSKDRDVYIQAWMMDGRLSVLLEKSIPDEHNPWGKHED